MRIENTHHIAYQLKQALKMAIEAKETLLKSHVSELTEKQKEK